MPEATAQMLSDLFDQITVAVFLVSNTGHLLFANRAGKAMIEDGWPVRLANSQLVGIDPPATEALKNGFDKSASDGAANQAICLAIAGKERPSAIGYLRAVSAGETRVSMLLVTHTGRTADYGLDAVAGAYGLSKAETRILKHLVASQSLPEVAQRLNLSLPTVKSHMRRILNKTRCSRQADLIRIVEAARSLLLRAPRGSE